MRFPLTPSRSLTVLILATLLAWPALADTADPIPEGTPNGFVVHRGTNISHWLSQSRRRGEERKRFFTEEDVALIERLGYDHIRIPVDEEQLWDDEGRPEEEAFDLLDAGPRLERGPRTAGDRRPPHPALPSFQRRKRNPCGSIRANRTASSSSGGSSRSASQDRPVDQVAYELLNEAVADDPEDWNRLLARGVAAVREREPERTVVIGSNLWQQVETFDQLRIPEGDPNILLSFHFYTPMALTHYGASWTPVGRYQGPVSYPGRVVEEADLVGLPDDLVDAVRDGRGLDFDRDAFAALVAEPLALARKAGLPLYCGEWGALPAAPRGPRMRWYRDVRSVLEEHGIGWAHWDYKGGFGVVDRERHVHLDLAQVLLGEDLCPSCAACR